jgi:arogenate dehydrogenase (NADP+)
MNIGVYGLGRFGFFWAHLLAQHFSVSAYSRSAERKTPSGVERITEDELLRLPVLFICTSISAFDQVIERIAGRLSPGTLLLDTCSVKTYPVRVMERYVPEGVEILATHPMFGPDSAKDGVGGLPMVLCPVRISSKTLEWWRGFFQGLGLRVMIMSPQQHDREAAFTQGITHFVGRVLADLNLKESDIATLGYVKLLEIKEQTCNDPWQLFLDLQRFNPYTQEMRTRLNQSLTRILEQLGTTDEAQKGTDEAQKGPNEAQKGPDEAP